MQAVVGLDRLSSMPAQHRTVSLPGPLRTLLRATRLGIRLDGMGLFSRGPPHSHATPSGGPREVPRQEAQPLFGPIQLPRRREEVQGGQEGQEQEHSAAYVDCIGVAMCCGVLYCVQCICVGIGSSLRINTSSAPTTIPVPMYAEEQEQEQREGQISQRREGEGRDALHHSGGTTCLTLLVQHMCY